MKNIIPSSLICDFYKTSHKDQYPKKTELIYSTFTPRSNKYFPSADKVVVFGIQGFIKKYLINYFNEHFFSRPLKDVINEYVRVIKFTLGIENPDYSHIEELHNLGYLPIKIKALKEGSRAPIKTPVLTIENTDKRFFWLTNYLETLISTEIWLPMTSATIAQEYRKVLDEYAIKTTGSTAGVDFQAHDFSMRGMSSVEGAMTSGAAHLLSFTGTDTIPAILYLEEYYNANIENELVGASIPATEHSVMCAGTLADGDRDEYDTFKRILTEIYPNGFVSVVSDSYDFWKVVTETLPSLKHEIMTRDGRLVVRPDSGNPVNIICGKHYEDLTNERYIEKLEDAKVWFRDAIYDDERAECGDGYCGESEIEYQFKYNDKYYEITYDVFYNRHDKRYYYIDEITFESMKEIHPTAEDKGLIECLWETFSGTVTKQGYKVLDSHIGAIYGDSITLQRAKEICERLEKKGFASTNIVFGLGSYTYQYNTRDTLGFAMKATYAVINGEEHMLFKDPKTDDGTKRSQRGRVAVVNVDGELVVTDSLNQETYDQNFAKIDQLEDVFVNGELVRDETLSEIRSRIKN